MKFAGHTMGMPQLDIFGCIDLMGDLGFDGVEVRVAPDGHLNDLTYDATQGERVREHARAKDVEICCLTPYYQDLLDPAIRQDRIDGLHRVVDMAHDLGCGLVRAHGGPEIPEGDDTDVARDTIADGLREVGDYAAERDVRIAVETHGGSGTYSVTEAADMMRRVAHPAVGVLFDIAWTWRAGRETIQETMEWIGDQIIHCHVKDFPGPGPDGDFRLQVLPGSGCLPWRDLLAGLTARGYDGYLCDEYEKFWKPELPEPQDWFPQSLHAMRQLVTEAKGGASC